MRGILTDYPRRPAIPGMRAAADSSKNYRSTEQFLSREMVLFLTGEGGYKESSSPQAAFIYFVERCEGAIEAENISALDVMTLGQPDAKPARTRDSGEK